MLKSFVAAVGASLILLPGALSPGSATQAAEPRPPDYPPGTTLSPGALERGADTPLLHMAEEVIVDGASRVPVKGLPHVRLLGRAGSDYVVEAATSDYTRYTIRLVHPDGTRRILQRYVQPREVLVSADGRRLALVTVGVPTRVRVVKTRTAELVARRSFPSPGAKVSDFDGRRLVVGSYDGPTWWWDTETGTLTKIVDRLAFADISADRLVVLTPNPRNPDAFCQRTVRLSRPGVVLWRSCQDIPAEFSPNGHKMITWYINEDGIGPGVLQVRRQDGTVLRTFRAPLFFGFTVWESNSRVLLQPVGTTYVAAVRCVLGDGCERASRLYASPGTYDPPETMRWSFPR